MVCLNLPPSERYKRENVYLAGVMPGPKAPSLHQTNHFLDPLVDDLLVLWRYGARLPRTALRPHNRLARCAAVPLISDLGAARKVSGHASHSAAIFCSFCQLKKADINNIDKDTWPCRDCATFRRLAEEWRSAHSTTRREALFKEHGVRYSVLLKLPYWKPTRYVVVETMHNLFLGLFQRHCRSIFGMDIKAASQD
ncbi:hypothetical protein BV20DRAFT_958951, partial [Pilatotrama ljubarskyi]